MIKVLGQFIFPTVIVSIVGFGFWLAYEPWLKLSKVFGSKLSPPKAFLKEQTCILNRAYLKGCINVGITEQKLYLSHRSPLSYFLQPLLIDLNAITKIELSSDPLLNRCYKFLLAAQI
ncbi:MAG: hypothetical protein HC764_08450 [Pleurocapsa sp. CRU_1_2]|nr:hypothetical protein [Pleurocapsa sp. CRU_1_2]